MTGKKDFTPPFAVMRQIGTSMEDQLVSGFARAIRSGAYADGMKLPGVRNLAVAFGVSEITIRNAVKRLCRDGLLAARPRVGLTVCASSGRSWRGVVVGLRSAHDSGMYYANVMEGVIASELMRGGWLFARMEWPDGSDGADIVGSLKCFSPALVVASFPPPAMLKALERSGLPFVQIWGEKTSAKARLAARPCADVALAELARRLAVHGVRKVISAYQLPKGIVCGAVLKKAGFSVRPMHIPPLNDYIPPENVQRAALETFDRMLSKGPLDADAIVFNDDYLAAGALSAFERHGVRMPEDIRLATVSNYGLGPVHFCPLTRLEVNPAHYGLEVAENLLKILDGKSVPRQMDLEATFIKGETA